MKIEPLDLSHQALLTARFSKLHLDISEYSFANCYLFRKVHEYEIVFDKEIFIRGKTYDGLRFLMPTFDIRNVEYAYLKTVLQENQMLFPIPEEWANSFSKEQFSQAFFERDSDYIYALQKIREMPGRHLSSRRNLIRQFCDLYSVTVESLTNERKKDAIAVLEAWEKHEASSSEKTDFEECHEAISRMEQLGLQGTLYLVDDKPVGFIIGEAISPHMFALHFAKACVDYKGVYQYMYQSFAKRVDDRFEFLNWEQDLGKEGLKKSKSAYQPDRFSKKIRLTSK